MSLMKNFNYQIYPYFLGLEMFADQIHWYFLFSHSDRWFLSFTSVSFHFTVLFLNFWVGSLNFPWFLFRSDQDKTCSTRITNHGLRKWKSSIWLAADQAKATDAYMLESADILRVISRLLTLGTSLYSS